MLVTSRRRGRWVLPKGNIKTGVQPHLSAELEAFEEGGVIGTINPARIGIYNQLKLLPDGEQRTVAVEAFALRVTREKRIWPEMRFRQRCWASLDNAIKMVDDEELQSLLRMFEDTLSSDK